MAQHFLRFVPLFVSVALLSAILASGQTKPAPGNSELTAAGNVFVPPRTYELTELQRARMDAVRQEIFRWQDKLTDALGKFSAQCTQAQKENKWPNVQCSLEDLKVTLLPAPEPAAIPKK